MISMIHEVEEAIRERQPVVALETSVVAHGLNYPYNLEAHRRCEEAIRLEGAIPAPVAVLRGVLRFGLCKDELTQLAEEASDKLSCADLAAAISTGKNGALTVSATMAAARLAGIPIMATGGIGGVHRDYMQTMDMSADLHELARTTVAVVCSGAKMILDIPATLQVLESLGIQITGYGTNQFPAFYAASSGHTLLHSVSTPQDAAALMRCHFHELKRPTGILFTQAAPSPMPAEEVEAAAAKAISQAQSAGMTGKALTPFLLRRMETITGGQSLEVNLKLLESNAQTAARIAVAYSKLLKEGDN